MTGDRGPRNGVPGNGAQDDPAPVKAAPDSHAPECSRTRRLIDRVVGDAVRPDDRNHAATCASCGPVLARAARFDDELRRTARGLVAEELPRGILDPGLAGNPKVISRRAGPGLAGIFAAVAIMVLAMSVALLPGGLVKPSALPSDGPPGTPPGQSGVVTSPGPTGLQLEGPALHSTAAIGGSLIREPFRWTCSSGRPPPSPATDGGVDHEGIVCTSRTGQTYTATLITGETVDNEVIEVAIKGELVVDTQTSVSQLADAMAYATSISVGDKDRAPTIAEWVLFHVPGLKALPGGDSIFGIFGEGTLRLTLQRGSDGSYFLLLQAMPR
jgi:hypothetical protein